MSTRRRTGFKLSAAVLQLCQTWRQLPRNILNKVFSALRTHPYSNEGARGGGAAIAVSMRITWSEKTRWRSGRVNVTSLELSGFKDDPTRDAGERAIWKIWSRGLIAKRSTLVLKF
jgi:hypothetical protein